MKNTLLWQSPLFFSKVYLRSFFLTRFLIDRCPIVTGTCKIMFQSLFGSLLNHLYRYGNENVSVKPLSLICITPILTTIDSLKNRSVNHSIQSVGFFGKNFGKLQKKKNVIHQPRSISIGEKLCALSWVPPSADKIRETDTSQIGRHE